MTMHGATPFSERPIRLGRYEPLEDGGLRLIEEVPQNDDGSFPIVKGSYYVGLLPHGGAMVGPSHAWSLPCAPRSDLPATFSETFRPRPWAHG